MIGNGSTTCRIRKGIGRKLQTSEDRRQRLFYRHRYDSRQFLAFIKTDHYNTFPEKIQRTISKFSANENIYNSSDQKILIANVKVIINRRIGVSDIQGRIKQHKLSSPAKAKALRRPLRMFEKQAFGFIIINRNQAKSNNLSGYLY